LLHNGGPQRPVRGVWPAVAEQNGPDRTPLVRLQQLLLGVAMGARLGAGQKPSVTLPEPATSATRRNLTTGASALSVVLAHRSRFI
jgi:hypothetical protein